MYYPCSFFALQLAFAQRVAARFDLSLANALLHYTTFAVNLPADDNWELFAHSLAQASDPLEVTYRWHMHHYKPQPAPQPHDTTFREYPLFGCFYYAVRDTTIIRTHFTNNDDSGDSPLGRVRQSARWDDLRRMFSHIRAVVPTATTVMGHSWLYNLPAYTRLFPPSYTSHTEENPDGVLSQLVLWYQCYDRFWGIKTDIAATLLQRVDEINDVNDLRLCFPYQRLRVRAPIADFYTFYNIAQ